jgi:glycosyltransferase involved in cell wall biosynthesis
MIEKVGILPWSPSSDAHQRNFKTALEEQGVRCTAIPYHFGLPLYKASRYPMDLLVLDWVHSFFISKSYPTTLVKTSLSYLDRMLTANRSYPIIWNMHNLHRHDKLHQSIEHYNFKRFARHVDGIRVFSEAAIDMTRYYLELPSDYPIQAIPQIEYLVHHQTVELLVPKTDPKDLHLLFFGTIREGKGLEKFIESFQEANVPNVKLVIAGRPVDALVNTKVQHLIHKNGNNIQYINRFIAEEELASLFASADAVVLPYEYILNSGVVLLANKFLKPIVATDITLFKQQLSSEYAILENLFQVDCLVRALEQLKKSDLKKMGVASGEKALENKSEQVVSQFLSFGNQLIENKKRKRLV